ncbi:MAG: zinc ABC transporter substrate-binding protein [bacterium]
MAPRRLALVLIPLALWALACNKGGGGGIFSAPQPAMTRLVDQPYEWDSPLSEADWNASLAKLPVLDRPLKVVTSVPEVAVVVKYIGRDALQSLYSVMPLPALDALTPGTKVTLREGSKEGGKSGVIKSMTEGTLPTKDAAGKIIPGTPTTYQVEIEGGTLTIQAVDMQIQQHGRLYEKFDIAAETPDPVPEGQTAPASRKEQTLAKLKDADVVFLAGPGVDDWMKPLVTESGTTATVIDLSERMNWLVTQRPVSATAGEPGERYLTKYVSDPCNYWWMSLRPTSLAVDSLDMVLGRMVPSKAADISKWREDWLNQLGGLDSAIAQFMLDDPKLDANSVIVRRVLIDTPDLAWFCYRWDLQVVDVINTNATDPPSPERVKEIIKKAQEQYVSMIITTSGYRSPAVDEIAKALTVEIMDPQDKDNPDATTKKVPVPVCEIVLGLNQAGKDTDDYVPWMLYDSQKLGLAYKPIVDGLYTLKKHLEDAQKQKTEDAAKAAEPSTPPADGVTPPGEGTTPPAETTPEDKPQ